MNQENAKIKAVLFDLDGTLLPMDQDEFVKAYFKLLAARMMPKGYEPNELIECIWAGTKAMIKNDGGCRNEEAFWHCFEEKYGEDAMKDKPYIDAFYAGDFEKAKVACGFNEESAEVIRMLQEKGMPIILATNPLFPAVATEKRMRWAGLMPEDFLLYTTYENSHYCKPNPKYYQEILQKAGLQPEECLMVGNDVQEDMVTAQMGMKVFLLTDCLINKEGRDISEYPHGGFAQLKEYLQAL